MEGTRKALFADDEPGLRRLAVEILAAAGLEVVTAEDGQQTLEVFEAEAPDIVIVDLKMPRLDGLEVLRRLKQRAPQVPVVLVTAYGDISTAVAAIRLGAYDFLTKPFLVEDFVATVRRALERQALLSEVESLKRQIIVRGASLSELMGQSPAIQKVIEQIEQVAASSFTVVVCGETGTGKELVARAIHEQSERRHKPLVAVDCGAIPETLIESELFGHEKGAFTGADRRKEGYFQIAEGGTLFLDEVTNLPVAIQVKLLRALQERTIQPVGAAKPTAVDVRIVAATNVTLEREVDAGRFRQDLYYRLGEFTVTVPPLRDRPEDIPELARRFLSAASVELGRVPPSLSDEAMHTLIRDPWPGNVRQLRNVIRQAVLTGPAVIRPWHLRLSNGPDLDRERLAERRDLGPVTPLKAVVENAIVEAERRAIDRALRDSRGNKSEAARALTIDYKTLYLKMKRYSLRAEDYRA